MLLGALLAAQLSWGALLERAWALSGLQRWPVQVNNRIKAAYAITEPGVGTELNAQLLAQDWARPPEHPASVLTARRGPDGKVTWSYEPAPVGLAEDFATVRLASTLVHEFVHYSHTLAWDPSTLQEELDAYEAEELFLERLPQTPAVLATRADLEVSLQITAALYGATAWRP